MKLSPEEALAAMRRRKEYEHNLAIEGIFLTPEEERMMEFVDRERMGYEEGVQFAIGWCRRNGVIPAQAEALEEAE